MVSAPRVVQFDSCRQISSADIEETRFFHPLSAVLRRRPRNTIAEGTIDMPGLELSEPIQAWANMILMWIGFGTITGLMAKAIMPGRDPGGAVATLCMGIGGAVIGCGVLAYFWEGARVSPITPIGFVVAIAGAFVLLFFYRLLAGYWFIEGEVPRPRYAHRHSRGRRRRRYDAAIYDE